MTAPAIQREYPLRWPTGRPRAPADERKPALFRADGRRLTWTSAERRLFEQVDLLTPARRNYRVADQVLTCNIRFTASNTRDRNISRAEPADPGVAFYFRLDRRPHVLACDKWDTVYDNIGAIAAHIEALRGQERCGVGDIAQAFAGYQALPAPEQWWQVLGVRPDADLGTIRAVYNARIRDAHPDRGGSDAAAARLNAARDKALKERG